MQKTQYRLQLLRAAACAALSCSVLCTACTSALPDEAVTMSQHVKSAGLAQRVVAEVAAPVEVAAVAAAPAVVRSGQELPWGIQGSDVSARFTGQVFFKALIERNPQYLFQQTNLITFAPQARSAWHCHGPMYLIGIGGLGYYQAEGQDAILIKPGDVVFCPPDVRHWHGAAPNSWFAQIVIYDSAYVPEQPWPESAEVTAEEYQQATAAQ